LMSLFGQFGGLGFELFLPKERITNFPSGAWTKARFFVWSFQISGLTSSSGYVYTFGPVSSVGAFVFA